MTATSRRLRRPMMIFFTTKLTSPVLFFSVAQPFSPFSKQYLKFSEKKEHNSVSSLNYPKTKSLHADSFPSSMLFQGLDQKLVVWGALRSLV